LRNLWRIFLDITTVTLRILFNRIKTELKILFLKADQLEAVAGNLKSVIAGRRAFEGVDKAILLQHCNDLNANV
jgi:hypothetical protein